jgi:hypothetical protein
MQNLIRQPTCSKLPVQANTRPSLIEPKFLNQLTTSKFKSRQETRILQISLWIEKSSY